MDAIAATNRLNAQVMPGEPTVIPHGVDTDIFLPAAQAPHAKVVACVGRVRPKKGTAEFVSAMCHLLPSHPDWAAVIVGRIDDEAYADVMRNEINSKNLQDRITFLPARAVETMPDFYRDMSLLVTPSHLEGFGLTPIEAGASGVPCVATRDVGCFNEAIVEGLTGGLATCGDSADFARAIEPFLADDGFRAQASIAARAHVEKHFSIEAEAEALNALCTRVLDE
jgi:mannosyltransferase